MGKLLKMFVYVMLSLALAACNSAEKPKIDNSNNIAFDEGKVYDEPDTYDDGIITADGAIIKNARFNGNLIVDEAVLDGDVTLINVRISGDLIVRGGGQNSIHIEGSQIENIISSKEGNPVRILTDEFSSVKNITMENPTVLVVSGKVDSLTVNPNAAGSDVKFDEKSVIKDVTINGNIEFSSETPINDLVLNASSNLKINSSVASLQLTDKASDTKIVLGEKSVVSNVVTTVPVEISGTGKVEKVVTDNQNNITGEVKADNVEIKQDPFIGIKPSPSATPSALPTPKPTPKPTVRPTATPSPSVVPTAQPTADPTPIPAEKYTVEFVINSKYHVASQTIAKGSKVANPNVTLIDEFKGSYLIWYDENDQIFDFNTTITKATKLVGRITIDANNENIVDIINSDKVSNINIVSDITVDAGFILVSNLSINGNGHILTVNKGNAFTFKEDGISLQLVMTNVVANSSQSIGIYTANHSDFSIKVDDSILKVNARGISSAPSDNNTSKIRGDISVVNSEILNMKTSNYDTSTQIDSNSRGVALKDFAGQVDIVNSYIYGFGYGINVGGDINKDLNERGRINVDIVGSSIKSWGALNIWGSNGRYTIRESTLKGINTSTGKTNTFATIVLNRQDNELHDDDSSFRNIITLENSLITNFQSNESKLSGLNQNLIRMGTIIDQLVFKGEVRLIDTSCYSESSIDLYDMNDLDAAYFENNNIVKNGATIISENSEGQHLPLIINPYILPTISNTNVIYEESNENLVVEFELDKGFMITAPLGIEESAIENAYRNLLINGVIGDNNSSINNDIILNYYYIKDDLPISLKTINGKPLVKNKFWEGYLNYRSDEQTIRLESGDFVDKTYLGVRVPDNKTWVTSTNPLTGTVASGWLDEAKGHTVYVDIVVVYNDKLIKQTVSIDLPAEKETEININNTPLMFNEPYTQMEQIYYEGKEAVDWTKMEEFVLSITGKISANAVVEVSSMSDPASIYHMSLSRTVNIPKHTLNGQDKIWVTIKEDGVIIHYKILLSNSGSLPTLRLDVVGEFVNTANSQKLTISFVNGASHIQVFGYEDITPLAVDTMEYNSDGTVIEESLRRYKGGYRTWIHFKLSEDKTILTVTGIDDGSKYPEINVGDVYTLVEEPSLENKMSELLLEQDTGSGEDIEEYEEVLEKW